MKTVTVELTVREVTLLRVAALIRLNNLKRLIETSQPGEYRDDLQESYDETRELLTGKLWKARAYLSGKELEPD